MHGCPDQHRGRASSDFRIDWSPIRHALELDSETPRDLAAEASIFGSARTRWATPEYELDELVALGGLAVDAILRDDGKRGAAVAPPRDVSAAPAELPVTLVPRPAIRSGGT